MLFRLFRPILLGLVFFLAFNLFLTVGVQVVPKVRDKLNVRSDNLLPQKLELLEASPSKQFDVLFLGTSQTNNGFATHAFESALPGQSVQSFNLGLPGSRYDVMLTQLDYHIRHYGKPKMVMLEAADNLMEENGLHYYLPALQMRTLLDMDTQLIPFIFTNPEIAMNVKKELFYSSFSAVYRFRLLVSPISVQKKLTSTFEKALPASLSGAAHANNNPTEATPEDPVIQNSAFRAHGWHPKPASPMMATPEGVKENARLAEGFYFASMDKLYFDRLEAMLVYCKQQDIPVVLVGWPNHPEYLARFNKSKLSKDYYKGLRQISQRYHVPLIDLDDYRPEQVDGLFADVRHLTPKGAILFSEILAKQVSGQIQFSLGKPAKANPV